MKSLKSAFGIFALVFFPQVSNASLSAIDVNLAMMQVSFFPALVGLNEAYGLPKEIANGVGTVTDNGWTLNTSGPLSMSLSGSFDSVTNDVSFTGTGSFQGNSVTTSGSGVFNPSNDTVAFANAKASGDSSQGPWGWLAGGLLGLAGGILDWVFKKDPPPAPPAPAPIQVLQIQVNIGGNGKNQGNTVGNLGGFNQSPTTVKATASLTGFNGGVGTVSAMVSSVPEPEEWIMMLLGFGMVSWQVKRKQRKTSNL